MTAVVQCDCSSCLVSFAAADAAAAMYKSLSTAAPSAATATNQIATEADPGWPRVARRVTGQPLNPQLKPKPPKLKQERAEKLNPKP